MLADVIEIPGKGRGLVASRDILAGEMILEEAATFLIVEEDHLSTACSMCLNTVEPGNSINCQCGYSFCCKACENHASQSAYLHSGEICRALQNLNRSEMESQEATCLRLVLHVWAAFLSAKGDAQSSSQAKKVCELFEALHANPQSIYDAERFYERLTLAVENSSLNLEQVGLLLCKEHCNSFGVEPPGLEEERCTKGSAFFQMASLINHDCLPNIARFDSYEAASGESGPKRMTLRALHNIPKGEELTLSYFPLSMNYDERQQRCLELYGFRCSCLRCQRESSWSLESEIDDEMSAISSEDMPNSPHSQGSGLHESDAHNMSEDNGNSEHVDQGIDDGYIFVFITKYVCDRESCGGTICPIVEGGFYECNRCGFHSSEEDFQKRLQQLQEE